VLSGTDKVEAQCRTFDKPSGPVDVLGVKHFNITNISAGIKLTLDSLHDSPACHSILASDPLSVVNTEPIKLVNICLLK